MSISQRRMQSAYLSDDEAVQSMIDEEYFVYETGEMRREFVVRAVGQGYVILQSNSCEPHNEICAISGRDTSLMDEDPRLSSYLISPPSAVGRRDVDSGVRMDDFSRRLYISERGTHGHIAGNSTLLIDNF